MKRTYIKNLQEHLNETVMLQGHVHTIRKIGKMNFIVLRERTGLTQIVVPFKLTEPITPQSVIQVIGTIRFHKESSYNNIEIEAVEIVVISLAEILPLAIHKPEPHSLNVQYKYRPITLRQLEEIAIFKIQATLMHAYRTYLTNNNFIEISSPKLSKSGIEGGAELFQFEFYNETMYLTQSPQFYKQMMVGVYENVFEIGKVYRAEGSSNRHLSEYIGLDLEMGFIENGLNIIETENAVLQYMFNTVIEKCSTELNILNAKVTSVPKIPILHYNEVVEIMKFYNMEIGMEGLNHAQETLLGQHVLEKLNSEWVFIYPYPTKLRPFYAMPIVNSEFSETFELLYKGLEVTSGGQRIHLYNELCQSILNKNLNIESFESYLMPFKYGMPKHGGFGIGLERIMMQMLNLPYIETCSLIARSNTKFLH